MNKGKIVFIVEDDPYVIEVFLEIFDDKGIRALFADTQNEAISLFQKIKNEDVVIMLDYYMPRQKDGDPSNNTEDLLQRLRDKESFSGPIVATSSDALCRDRLIKLGASHQAKKSDAARYVIETFF